MQSISDRVQLEAGTYLYLLGLRWDTTALVWFVGIHETPALSVAFSMLCQALQLFGLEETMHLSHSTFHF